MESRASAPPAGQAVVLFDGVCNLCNRTVQFILDHDRHKRMLLCASQSDRGAALLAPFGVDGSEPSTVYLLEAGKLRARSSAALRIAQLLGLPWSLFLVFWIVPWPLRDLVYRFIARNRYRWFGQREACRVPQPGERERFLV